MMSIKVAYVSVDDPRDIHTWSGLPFHCAKALSAAGLELTYVGPLRERRKWFYLAKHAYYSRVRRLTYARDREAVIARGFADQVSEFLRHNSVDLVFATSTVPIAYLKGRQPIVTWVDATWPGMVDYYFPASRVCGESLKAGPAIEREAYRRIDLALFCSDWAARTAIDLCQARPDRVKVVPFGANIDGSRSKEQVAAMVGQRPTDCCRLLFMGVDWKRKGGDVAMAVAAELVERGIKTELVVAGCEPQISGAMPDWLRVVGFVSKSTESGRKMIQELFSAAHFLIMPSRAEAYGLVFCEANSFGVPCIASDVGGIPTIIRDGVNGKTFPLGTPPGMYCDFICNALRSKSDYETMAMNSFQEYETRLNWNVAGARVAELCRQLV